MALVEEDGTGVIGANSYLSVVDADALIAEYSFSDTWASLTVADKESYLKVASLEFDNLLSWTEVLLNIEQGLEHPRTAFYDKSGRLVEGISKTVKINVAKLAAAVSEGATNTSAVWLKKQSFGNSSEEYASPVLEESSIFYDIRRELQRKGYGASHTSIVTFQRS